MTWSVSKLASALLLAACAAGGSSVAATGRNSAPQAGGAERSPTAGEVALLGNKLDVDGVKAVFTAISASDPLVRVVAARIAGVTAHPPFAAPLATALEREQDPSAAAEQVRALLLIRGAAALEPIEARIPSLSASAAGVLAGWIANNQPQRLADVLPKLAGRVSEHRYELAPAVPVALKKFDGRQDDSGRLLRAWLAVSTPLSWRSMLRSLAAQAGGPWRDAVVIDALASKEPAIGDETVWSLVDAIARSRPVSSAVVDAAISGLSTPQTAQPTWSDFGRELIARYAGRQTPDRSALLAAEAARHASDARTIAMLSQATAQEKAALKTVLGKSYPSTNAASVALAVPGSSTMRTMPALWPGFLASLFEAAGCKADRTTEFGIVSVVYRPDGRLAKLGVEETGVKSACVQAATALARLTLEHPSRKPAPGTAEFLVLPIGADYVDCANRESTDFVEPMQIGGAIPEAPRKVRDVKPTYPPALLAQGVSGAVLLQGVISRTGCVSDLAVIGSVAPGMDFAALKAASAWRFEPALADGKPVPVIVTLTVNFTLQ
jgi:TonB family protein